MGETTDTSKFNLWIFIKDNALWFGLGLAIAIAVIVYFTMGKKKKRVRGIGAIGAGSRRKSTRRRGTARRKGGRRRRLSGTSGTGEVAKLNKQIGRLKGQLAKANTPKPRRRKR